MTSSHEQNPARSAEACNVYICCSGVKYLAELLQRGDVLQNHLGQGSLHEVGIHGVGCQHRLVGIYTRPKSSIQLHQRPAAQALQATGTASEEADGERNTSESKGIGMQSHCTSADLLMQTSCWELQQDRSRESAAVLADYICWNKPV